MVESLTAPYLLLAAPVMLDPNFAKTVVAVGHHTREGALGWIVNRLLGKPAVSLLAAPLDTTVHPETPLRVGGPVLTNGLVALFSDEVPGVESVEMAPGLRVSAAAEILPKLFAAAPAAGTLGILVLGYSGWAADQLESEMEEGSWLVLPWDPAFVFTNDVDGLWERALTRLGVDPASVSSSSTGVS
ncbi:MAG: YqgE/AlgH family protein [Thermoanaerobaculia bacterium]